MTIGEIEYTRFFTDQQLFLPTFSRVVFLTFCVMMPIVLMNLTVRLFSHFLFLYVFVHLSELLTDLWYSAEKMSNVFFSCLSSAKTS